MSKFTYEKYIKGLVDGIDRPSLKKLQVIYPFHNTTHDERFMYFINHDGAHNLHHHTECCRTMNALFNSPLAAVCGLLHDVGLSHPEGRPTHHITGQHIVDDMTDNSMSLIMDKRIIGIETYDDVRELLKLCIAEHRKPVTKHLYNYLMNPNPDGTIEPEEIVAGVQFADKLSITTPQLCLERCPHYTLEQHISHVENKIFQRILKDEYLMHCFEFLFKHKAEDTWENYSRQEMCRIHEKHKNMSTSSRLKFLRLRKVFTEELNI
jgi:hypothetical protein